MPAIPLSHCLNSTFVIFQADVNSIVFTHEVTFVELFRCRNVRRADRDLNKDNYPFLNFPELYGMHNGFKAFYETQQVNYLCFNRIIIYMQSYNGMGLESLHILNASLKNSCFSSSISESMRTSGIYSDASQRPFR